MKYFRQDQLVSAWCITTLITLCCILVFLIGLLSPTPALAQPASLCSGESPTVIVGPFQKRLSHPEYEARGWKVMLRTGPSMVCKSDPIWAEDNLQVRQLGMIDTDQSWSLLEFSYRGNTMHRWAETKFLENAGGSGGCFGASPSTHFSPRSRTLSHPQYERRGWKVMLRTGPSMDCGSDPIWAEDNLQVMELGTLITDQSWSLLRFSHGGTTTQRWAETKFLEGSGGVVGCTGAAPSTTFSPRSRVLSHPEYESRGWKVMLRTGPSMDCESDPIWANDNQQVLELGTIHTDQSWSLLQFNDSGAIKQRWAESKFLEQYSNPAPTKPTPINPPPSGVPVVIYDTDMGPDIDDALGLAALHAYANQGMAHIAAVTLSRKSNTGARYIDLLNTFYARPDIPIGVYRGTTEKDSAEHGYTRDIVNSGKYPHSVDASSLPQGHLLMRDVLRASADNSVVIIQVGFSTNTARLLEEYPDLVANKVRLLSLMAGDFNMPGGAANYARNAEFNVQIHPGSARAVFARWPNEIVVSERDLGASLLYPLSSIRNDFNYVTNHPIKDSYLNSTYSWHKANGDSYDMRSWDITSVVAAIQPDLIPKVLGPGKVIVSDSNYTSFNHGGGSHYVLAEGAQLGFSHRQQLVDLMIQLVSATPADNVEPVRPPIGNPGPAPAPPQPNACDFLQPSTYVPNYVRTTVSHSNYNLRPRPNSNCAPIGSIAASSQVKVHAESGNWRFVENLSGDGWGWLYRDAIEGSGPPNTDCDVVLPSSTIPTYVRTTTSRSNYNLRPQPNSDCPPIGSVAAGSRVKVHAVSGNWLYIENLSGSGWGWIFKQAIDG